MLIKMIRRFLVLLSVLEIARLYCPLYQIWPVGSVVTTSNFNSSKCKVLTVTRKKQLFRYDYTLNKVLLKKVAEEKAREGPWNHCHQHTFIGQAYQRCYLESK